MASACPTVEKHVLHYLSTCADGKLQLSRFCKIVRAGQRGGASAGIAYKAGLSRCDDQTPRTAAQLHEVLVATQDLHVPIAVCAFRPLCTVGFVAAR